MCFPLLIPFLTSIFGASTATTIVSTATAVVSSVASASAGEVIAVVGTGVVGAGVLGAAEGMIENTEKNNSMTRQIYKNLNEEKAVAERKISNKKERIDRKRTIAKKDYKKVSDKKSFEVVEKIVSLKSNARKNLIC